MGRLKAKQKNCQPQRNVVDIWQKLVFGKKLKSGRLTYTRADLQCSPQSLVKAIKNNVIADFNIHPRQTLQVKKRPLSLVDVKKGSWYASLIGLSKPFLPLRRSEQTTLNARVQHLIAKRKSGSLVSPQDLVVVLSTSRIANLSTMELQNGRNFFALRWWAPKCTIEQFLTVNVTNLANVKSIELLENPSLQAAFCFQTTSKFAFHGTSADAAAKIALVGFDKRCRKSHLRADFHSEQMHYSKNFGKSLIVSEIGSSRRRGVFQLTQKPENAMPRALITFE